MKRPVRTLTALGMFGATIVAVAPSAAATVPVPKLLAKTTGVTPVGAGSGWIVWSAGSGRWRLVAQHAGRRIRPSIGARSNVWDADIVERTPGRPWLVYSRCAHEEPRLPPLDRAGDSSGCKLYLYDLLGRREQALPGDASASALMPAFSTRNTVIFRRVFEDHQDLARISLATGAVTSLATLPADLEVSGLDARNGVIAYSTLRHDATGLMSEIWSLVPGGAPVKIAGDLVGADVFAANFSPAVTPSGIAYTYSAQGNMGGVPSIGKIFLGRAGGKARLLHDHHAEIDGLAWDGSRLVYATSGQLCVSPHELPCEILGLTAHR